MRAHPKGGRSRITCHIHRVICVYVLKQKYEACGADELCAILIFNVAVGAYICMCIENANMIPSILANSQIAEKLPVKPIDLSCLRLSPLAIRSFYEFKVTPFHCTTLHMHMYVQLSYLLLLPSPFFCLFSEDSVLFLHLHTIINSFAAWILYAYKILRRV